MIALVVALQVLGASDALSKTTLPGLSFNAPSQWKVSEDGDSRTWEEPDGDANTKAKLELTLWTVGPRTADMCVKQVQDNLEAASAAKLPDGGLGAPTARFDHVKVGGQPAIKSVVFDYVGGDASAKSDKNKVSTVTYVGCNGTTRWLMTMTSPAAKSPRFGALLKKIVDSVMYAAGN